jgi:conserved hypothetical protein (putative transposase or invertase)
MKKQKHYDHLNDYLFYKVMGERGDEEQLLGFLNAVLGKTGDDRFSAVEIIENKYLSPQAIGDKGSILDVRAVLQGKTKVNIEVQVRNRHNMDRRSLFYWSREYTESLEEGQDYKELPDVIAINVVNFDYPPVRNSHTRFHLREDIDHDIVLTDALEIHFLNMVQYRKQRKKILLDNPLNRWLVWLDAGSPPDLIAEVLKMDSAIIFGFWMKIMIPRTMRTILNVVPSSRQEAQYNKEGQRVSKVLPFTPDGAVRLYQQYELRP